MSADPHCARCDNTGWTPVDVPGQPVRMDRCGCRQLAFDSQRLTAARIPTRYSRCDLERFLTYDNERLIRALNQTRKFVEMFPVIERGLCFIGPAGIGKTHLAAAALRICVEQKRVRGLFYDVRDLLRLIRSTYNKDSRTADTEILGPVMNAELLVLDDLGAEKPSEWVEETLTLIINERYNARRPTIITTNFEDSPDERDLDSLRVRVGFRIHSRLHEMCEFLEFDGGDYRHLPPNGGAADLAALARHAPNRRLSRSAVLGARPRGQARASLVPPPGRVA